MKTKLIVALFALLALAGTVRAATNDVQISLGTITVSADDWQDTKAVMDMMPEAVPGETDRQKLRRIVKERGVRFVEMMVVNYRQQKQKINKPAIANE